MKKIIYMVAFGILFLASSGQASAAWNTYPSDCPNPLSIGNYTTGVGIQNGTNGCWMNKSVSASAGQTINVAVYYDNTNNADANNVVIDLNQSPAGSMSSKNSSYSFSGSLNSSVGSLSLSQVTANLSSSETLTFSQAKWFKKGSSSGVSLPSGQTGNEAFNGGLSMGTIANSDWGTILFSFSVGTTTQPQLCTDPSALNYGGALPCQPKPANCTISNFNANPTSITSGSSASLSWSTSDCTNVTISNLGYNVPTSGSQTVWPTSTKTYTLTAYSSTGATQTRTAVVYVNDNNNNNCSITNFSASDTNINDGDSSILRWDTNNCDRVKISSIGDVNESGSRTVYPSDDATYTLTAYNTDGSSETDTVRIYVDNNSNNSNNNCTIDSFNSNKINVNSGDAVTLRWSTSDCTNVTISNLGYSVPTSGSQAVYPSTTTTYTLNAYGNNNQSKSIQVNVNYYNPVLSPVTPIYNSNVVTTVATNISQTGAQLNGIVTNSIYGNTNVYFQYGTTVNMGIRTATRTVNGNSNFNDFVSNLSSNTIYYFQAFAEDTNGVSQGAIQVFKTLGYSTGVITTPVKQVIIQGPTVSSSSSPIVLRIENKYQSFGIGDIVDYTVYYKNISSSKLTNPLVQVIIPKGITLTNTSRGTYSENDRTLSVPIEDLNPSNEGVIYLQARVDSLDVNLAQIVTTAILVYTNPNGAQENAMAYVLNNPKVINLLGASAFFGNIFGLGLIGWLLLAILILLLVLIARSLYKRRNVVTTTTQKTISQ